MTSNRDVAQTIHNALKPLGVVPLDVDLPGEPSVGRLRQRGRPLPNDVGLVTLLDVDGVLMWEDGAVNVSSSMRRRGTGFVDGEVVTQLKYEKPLGLSSIIEKLYQLDTELTPRAAQGQPPGSALLEYDQTTWTASPCVEPAKTGRILLLVHGTFSNTENIVSEMRAAGAGTGDFLDKVRRSGYSQVLGFDHFTLSRSPFVNAVDLSRYFAQSKAELDVVCHSRGGLVCRWFDEALDPRRSRKRRIVFVGCPLQGTSLADPSSLRNGLNLMTNVGKMLGPSFGLIPFLAAAGGLVQILASVGNFAARSPLVDAGVGLIPGIAALARIQKNAELEALNHGEPIERRNYYAVSSCFKADEIGWRFWRLFNKLKAADIAAEYLVFDQDNDLVVDTTSMTHHVFGPSPNFADLDRFCRFDEQSGVHHTSYFRDQRTLDFVAHSFGLAS